MREKGYFFLLTIASIFGWASVTLIVFKVDPFTADILLLALFYTSIGIALYGTFFLLGWGIRKLFIRRMSLEYYIDILFRPDTACDHTGYPIVITPIGSTPLMVEQRPGHACLYFFRILFHYQAERMNAKRY